MRRAPTFVHRRSPPPSITSFFSSLDYKSPITAIIIGQTEIVWVLTHKLRKVVYL
jgi:hypothetical protein